MLPMILVAGRITVRVMRKIMGNLLENMHGGIIFMYTTVRHLQAFVGVYRTPVLSSYFEENLLLPATVKRNSTTGVICGILKTLSLRLKFVGYSEKFVGYSEKELHDKAFNKMLLPKIFK